MINNIETLSKKVVPLVKYGFPFKHLGHIPVIENLDVIYTSQKPICKATGLKKLRVIEGVRLKSKHYDVVGYTQKDILDVLSHENLEGVVAYYVAPHKEKYSYPGYVSHNHSVDITLYCEKGKMPNNTKSKGKEESKSFTK